MTHTKLYLLLAVMAGVAIFVFSRDRLTFTEKKQVCIATLGICPLVAFLLYFLLGDVHHEAAVAGGYGEETNLFGISATAFYCGLLASGAVLWLTNYVNDQRTVEYFAELQRQELRAIEQAKLDAQNREERMLQGRVQLAQLETKNRYLAMMNDATTAQAAADRDELERQEQGLIHAYKRYCITRDPMNQQDEATLADGFRQELGSRSIGRVDVKGLASSSNPQVQRILNGKPSISLTP